MSYERTKHVNKWNKITQARCLLAAYWCTSGANRINLKMHSSQSRTLLSITMVQCSYSKNRIWFITISEKWSDSPSPSKTEPCLLAVGKYECCWFLTTFLPCVTFYRFFSHIQLLFFGGGISELNLFTVSHSELLSTPMLLEKIYRLSDSVPFKGAQRSVLFADSVVPCPLWIIHYSRSCLD